MRLLPPHKPLEPHLAKAKQVLQNNWMGGYTRPAVGLYPHQWNWDSAFIAIGYASYQPERGMRELRHLFGGQWPSGMVPQIVFNTGALGGYFPEPDFWRCPEGRQTSGITMPPLHAVACLHLYRLSGSGGEARDFLAKMFPQLMACHQYLYRERDPEREGLVYIQHPWESGRDNAPAWDEPLRAIDLDRVDMPEYRRKDLDQGVDQEQRPTNDDYDRYVYLVDLFRRHGYDDRAIYRESPFLVQDVGFNSILCRDNRALAEIADILGRDRGPIDEWYQQTSRGIREKLWCESFGRYESYDLHAQKHLDSPSAMGFMPLFAGVVDSQKASLLYDQINSVSFCGLRQGNCFAIPDYDMTDRNYDQDDYWRGPVWLNINWMLAKGLEDYGYYFEAQIMRKDLLELAARRGFWEYYDSKEGRGLGSRDFSWSAALFIDVLCDIHRQEDYDPYRLGVIRGAVLGETVVLNPDGGEEEQGAQEIISGLYEAMADLAGVFFQPAQGSLDYAGIAGSGQYRRYQDAVSRLHALRPQSLGQGPEGLAFWLNLYNFLVIQGVIELGLQDSLTEAPDFFDRVAYRVGPHCFSLNDIQHGVLRGNRRVPNRLFPRFWPWDRRRALCFDKVDPRVHFALCCGSRSCASADFFQARELDERLDQVAETYIATEVLVDPEDNLVIMAEMFRWYQDDFGGREQMLCYVAGCLPDEGQGRFLLDNLERVRIEYLFHDWHLNR